MAPVCVLAMVRSGDFTVEVAVLTAVSGVLSEAEKKLAVAVLVIV